MNILFIIGIYPNYGGTERMTTILSNSFAEQGHNVSIASFEQRHPGLTDELKGVALYSLSKPINSKRNRIRLHDIIKDNKIDLIINQWCLPFYVTRLLNKARSNTNAKIISVLHGVPDRSKILIKSEDAFNNTSGLRKHYYKIRLSLINMVVKYSLRYVYKNTDSYVVLSPSFIKSFQKYSGLKDTNKLTSIGNPITIKTDYKNDWTASKEPIVLYVGRMDLENKRVNRIIEAWEELYVKFSDWKLILIGDGPHKQQLEEYVRNNNIQRVEFTGFIKEDPIDFYKRASILMLTSDLEGFGLVIVEGMSFGVIPVVYGSYSAVYDIIVNGFNGYITSIPYSQEKTVEVMSRLMSSRHLCAKMSKSAKESSYRFNLHNIVQQWNDLFNAIVTNESNVNIQQK